MMQLTRSQLTRQIRVRRCHPTLASHVERVVMVRFPLLFISPQITILSPWLLFPIKLLSCWPCRLPSLSWKDKYELPVPSPSRMSHGEGSDREISSHVYPPHLTLFLTPSFSNLIVIPLVVQVTLPQSIKGTRAHHHHPHPRVVWKRR